MTLSPLAVGSAERTQFWFCDQKHPVECDLAHNAASEADLELLARTEIGDGPTKPYAGKNYERGVLKLSADCDGRLDLAALRRSVTSDLGLALPRRLARGLRRARLRLCRSRYMLYPR